MRKHKYLFSVFTSFQYSMFVDPEYTVRKWSNSVQSEINYTYIYRGYKKPVSAGWIFKVIEIDTYNKKRTFYAIAVKKLYGRNRGFQMIELNGMGFEYYKSLAVELRL
jgi:hypothetical protein